MQIFFPIHFKLKVRYFKQFNYCDFTMRIMVTKVKESYAENLISSRTFCKIFVAHLLALDLGIIVGKTISFSMDFSLIPCVGRKHRRSCNGILCFLPFSSVHLIFFIISSNVKVFWTTLPSKSICNNGTSIPWSALILEI